MIARTNDRAIISGIGISDVGRRLGIPALELTTAAARQAIADAGIAVGDLDGVATMGDVPADETAAALGIAGSYRGGDVVDGGLLSPLMSAVLAVTEGRARHVLVYRTVQMLGGTIGPPADNGNGKGAGTGAGKGGNGVSAAEAAAAARVMGDMAPLLAAHAYSAANWLAMHCQRHMHLYGTTKEQLGWLAVESRAKAAHNPLAAYREPITMDQYLAARPISSPFGLLDCDVPVDGSIALVVSQAEHAADCPSAVGIEAMGRARGAGGWTGRSDFPAMASVDAAADLWSRTDLRPTDVDVAELYDGFTFLTFAWLEALGLCEQGGAGPFVEGGSRIALDGELPLNTYGGQLSAGRMHGYWVVHEACLQLRGQAGARQVAGGPEVAVVAAGGGPIAGCLLLTG